MGYYRLRDPGLILLLLAIAGAVVAYRSWVALRVASYDKKSYTMNRYSFGCGVLATIFFTMLFVLWEMWLRAASN